MDDSYPLPPRLADLAADLPPGILAFTPEAVRARQDGWSEARQRGFILRLALCGSVGRSAAAVGMTRKSAYRLRARPGAEALAAAWDKALACGRDSRVDHAIERAVVGQVRPYFYKGRKCGETVHFNEGLTIAVVNLMAREGIAPDGAGGRGAA
ncbi:MAG: hypothetical protein ACJ8EB_14165 [Allosphingosinicella sp.]